jgi:transglutaminase-like putative cysteine protease
MKYKIIHTTTYKYESSVGVSHNRVILTPRDGSWVRNLWHRLTVHPAPQWSVKRHDQFGNLVHVFGIEEGHSQLTVTAASQVEVGGQVLPSTAESPAWESLVALPTDCLADSRTDANSFAGSFAGSNAGSGSETRTLEDAALEVEVAGFRFRSPRIEPSELFAKYGRASFRPRRPILEAAAELNTQIYRDFKYDKNSTDAQTPIETAFAQRRGVCQDFAQIQVAVLRSLGLSARYVSGYLRTLPPPGKERLVGADQSHAWVSLYCGRELGWVDLDATNNTFCGQDHIPIAWGRDYTDVIPFRGVFLGDGRHKLEVSVDVCPTE